MEKIIMWSLVIVVVTTILSVLLPKQKPTLRYKKQKSLLTPAELKFFKFLRESIPSHLSIMCKVRLADLITPDTSKKDYMRAFNKIKSKHIDFVLIDNQTGEIKTLIELNDRSHLKPERRERDHFLYNALNDVGLHLIVVKTKKEYSIKDIHSAL